MMRRHPTIVIISLCWLMVEILGATTFPTFAAEDLDGKTVLLPTAMHGQTTLLIISFARKAQNQARDWEEKTCSAIAGRRLNCRQVIVLEDVPRLFRGFIKNGIAKSVPPQRHSQFCLLFQGEIRLKQIIAYQKEEEAYLMLLDSTGEIIWQTHGAIDETKRAALAEQLAKAK